MLNPSLARSSLPIDNSQLRQLLLFVIDKALPTSNEFKTALELLSSAGLEFKTFFSVVYSEGRAVIHPRSLVVESGSNKPMDQIISLIHTDEELITRAHDKYLLMGPVYFATQELAQRALLCLAELPPKAELP